tara:strand:+ start:44 stop:1540 length:1497 start_codon:yes stop_codon:yes gene_type:complete
MSYRNPARIVDTQSGQHFRNMQQSLAKTFTGVINADTARIIKEAEKAEKEQSLVVQKIEKQDQAARDAAVQSSVESGTDTEWNLEPLLKANASATGLKPGQRTEDDKKVMTNTRNLKPVLMGAMSNVVSYEETFESVIAKQAGSEGGLNRWSKANANKIKGLSIFYSGKNGRSEGTVDPYSGVASLKAYWKGEGGEELVTEISSKGVDIELDTVPETKQSRVDMTANLLKMMKLEKGNSDVFIGAKATSRVEEGTNRTIWSRKPTREAVEKALYTDALATVMGMSAAEGIVWSNNRSGMGPKVDGFITSSYTDEEKYVKNDKGIMVPRPEIVAIAEALAKNALDTEGQQLLANIEYAGIGAPKESKPNAAEIKEAAMAKKYKLAKKAITSSTDDLNFGAKGYDTESQYDRILSFAGRGELGITVEKIEDEKGEVDKIIVKSLNNPRQEYVIVKGSTSEKVKGILLKAAQGSDTAEDDDYENLTDKEKYKKLMEQYKKQ